MELPEKLKFKGILEQGSAFKAKLDSDNYPRYYFVLNLSPETDTLLVLLTSTTRFMEHRNCLGGDDVHVHFYKGDYVFEDHCLICCDRPQKPPKSLVEAKLRSQKYELLESMPPDILQKVLDGISNSPVVEGDTKAMVLGDD